MANTLKFGNGQWATKEGSTLAYNDENGNFKPLPFTFDRDTSATRVNKQGLIEVVSNNEPRIDFKDDSNGALLLEPSRSNAITYSNDFTLGGWVSNNVTVTSNYGTSPDGNLNSTKLIFGSGTAYLNRASGVGVGDQSSSIYVKGISGQILKFGKGNNVGGGDNFTLNGEWQRLVHLSTNSGTAFHITSNLGGANATEIEIYGAQLEQGSYATSYIPTQGSVVTRDAEVCEQTPPSGIINSSEGSFFLNLIDIKSQNFDSITLNDNSGTENNQVRIWFFNNTVTYQYQVGGSASAQISSTTIDLSTEVKISCTWKLNEFKFFVNGIKIGEDLSGAVLSSSVLSKINFSRSTFSGVFYGKVKDVRVYNTALTDAELQALTS